jgi:23S rRNA (cytosine1962-C5)-methyltransferase
MRIFDLIVQAVLNYRHTTMKRIILKAREERRILSGHPWVYDNEIAGVLDSQAKPAVLEPGELADVESSRREYLGRAFANPNSKITARIYSPSKEGVDKGFFKRRIRKAILARSCCDLRRESARLIFAEADFLPGLIIDRFVGWPLDAIQTAVKERPLSFEASAALGPPASWLSVQFLAYGMDARRELILDALEEVLAAPLLPGRESLGAPAGIIEKSGVKVRELEGLAPREGLVRGNFPPSGIAIFENGLPFAAHLEEGQKTGHFLDQRDNRRLAAACLSRLSQEEKRDNGPKVLDAFSYTGCFGIYAARAGAESVVCVDVSAAALETLNTNAALNGVSGRIKTAEADAFEYLRAAERKKERFDLVILDPPAFAKTRASLEGAIRGYKEINLRAISLLSKGGIIVTSSCSQAMDDANFKRMITEAAADAGRRLVETDFRRQSADHPILVGYDESFYLKCGFYRAVD